MISALVVVVNENFSSFNKLFRTGLSISQMMSSRFYRVSVKTNNCNYEVCTLRMRRNLEGKTKSSKDDLLNASPSLINE